MSTFRKIYRQQDVSPISSFANLSEDEVETHMAIHRYNDFELTDAIRPSYDLKIVPREGYRCEIYRDDETNTSMPALMIAASREKLWDLFEDLLEPLGEEVGVVLETSHMKDPGMPNNWHQDFYNEHFDTPVLRSILYNYRDLLLNDGCTGIAVMNASVPLEVQFDEHKLIIIYAEQMTAFQRILHNHDVFLDQHMKFITDAEHVHSTSGQHAEDFGRLVHDLGMDYEEDLFT